MSSPNLDDEVSTLQAQITTLKSQLHIQASTLLASPSTQQLITSSATPPAEKQRLLSRSASQQAHNQQCLYRACAGLTTFRARDPDPNAVDNGAILGLRIEVVSRAKFLRPYYVLLNRPFPGSAALRVHRHTVPPNISVAGLANRYLPSPKGEGEGKQDLARFARALRRDVVRYHHRLGVVADLRKAAGLGKRGKGGEEEDEGRLSGITAADAEAKQISIEWADGRAGRLVMGADGEVVRVVALGDNGKDRDAVRELLGGATRVEDMVKRLAST
ncbi:Cenp-O kinetochore centromere component-domain-containing protein [Podospora aff. communis PSN243]|uniref:Cenp-O kinetochore centromere component-domain-containing protein n=1 Tax=Podospora aff. communis PSN243 TaxID=3040156 RepID=A0AAV9H0Q6_9PEZI|nr:Cenp-O kinetochore centromere component-domain-containing protein [Podospora aff. communis PSN243]